MQSIFQFPSVVGWFLVGVIFFSDTAAQFDVLRDVRVPASWRLIFDFDNQNNYTVTPTTQWKKGFQNAHRQGEAITATHQFGIAAGQTGTTPVVAAGERFQVKELAVQLQLHDQYTHTNAQVKMTESEIYDSTEVIVVITIPPRARFRRWQLMADVGGEEIGCNYIIDTIDNAENVAIQHATVKLLLGRKIELGTSRFRIKHKQSGSYLTVVRRKGWPAATLSRNSDFYFFMWSAYSRSYRILTTNSTDNGYDVMYSSTHGGVYFDQYHAGYAKQLWTISKPFPLYLGDEVTIMNDYWTTAGLCYYEGPATTVYCLYGEEDVWILC
jgi:hypothetical protein